MWTEDGINKTLQEISSRIPEKLRKALYTEELATPTVKMVMEEALKSDSISPEKKEQIRSLQEAGYFDKKKYAENPKIVGMIDNYMNREFKKAIKDGRLPGKKKLKELQEQWKKQKLSTSSIS